MSYDPSLYSQSSTTARLHGQQHVTSTTVLTPAASAVITLGISAATSYTVFLPVASSAIGIIYDFKRDGTGPGIVTVSAVSGDTIDGVTSLNLSNAYDDYKIGSAYASGIGFWNILNKYPQDFPVYASTNSHFFLATSSSSLPNATVVNSASPLFVAYGGTGGSSATLARSSLSIAQSGTNSDITLFASLRQRHNSVQFVTGSTALSSSSPGTTIVLSATSSPTITLPDASTVSGLLFTIINEACSVSHAVTVQTSNSQRFGTPETGSTICLLASSQDAVTVQGVVTPRGTGYRIISRVSN